RPRVAGGGRDGRGRAGDLRNRRRGAQRRHRVPAGEDERLTVVRRIAMLLGVVLVVASCAVLHPTPPSGFVDGASIHTINVGGLDRVYRLHKPAGLSAPASLVVVLHGGFG